MLIRMRPSSLTVEIHVLNGVALLAFVVTFALERWRPGWRLPSVRGWWRRAVAINVGQGLLVLGVGALWQRAWPGASLFELPASWSAWQAGGVAYLAGTLVFYWWHRARHEAPALWRHLHQLHHSARRMEVLTAFYRHPLEVLSGALLGAVLAYGVFGLDASSGAVYSLLSGAAQIFIHANLRTPQWLGWFVQRPEMHRIHHQRNHHASNYGDIVLWDMLFGTYDNPPQWRGRCGFDAPRERRVHDMLLCRDVHDD
jgi:sterol desaturase/sphingolipid hydroxylase (fatty acid hydroxylase superfamily)